MTDDILLAIRTIFGESAALETVQAWLPPGLAQALRDLADREGVAPAVLASVLLAEAVDRADRAYADQVFTDLPANVSRFSAAKRGKRGKRGEQKA